MSNFRLIVLLAGYFGYLAGCRDRFTDTYPPHAEGADWKQKEARMA